MTYIAFELRGQLYLLEPEEAGDAITRLQAAIAESSHPSGKIEPPALIDGFLTRESVGSFFKQFGIDATRSGFVFNLITKVAVAGRVPFNVVCGLCGQHASQPCAGRDSGDHNSKADDLRVEAASLVEHSEAFLGSSVRGLNKGSRSKFKTLLDSLEDARRE